MSLLLEERETQNKSIGCADNVTNENKSFELVF